MHHQTLAAAVSVAAPSFLKWAENEKETKSPLLRTTTLDHHIPFSCSFRLIKELSLRFSCSSLRWRYASWSFTQEAFASSSIRHWSSPRPRYEETTYKIKRHKSTVFAGKNIPLLSCQGPIGCCWAIDGSKEPSSPGEESPTWSESIGGRSFLVFLWRLRSFRPAPPSRLPPSSSPPAPSGPLLWHKHEQGPPQLQHLLFFDFLSGLVRSTIGGPVGVRWLVQSYTQETYMINNQKKGYVLF